VPFTERDIRDAARLLALIASSDSGSSQDDLEAAEREGDARSETLDEDMLLSRAKRHLRERQLRSQFFKRTAFGEPAWDILLILYISEFAGRRLRLRTLADRIEAPLSTTQRWIGYLEKERFVGREEHPDDKRMFYLRLLDRGRTVLNEYFAALPE
jgi:DNA-binding MarR family transcriptional regulator